MKAVIIEKRGIAAVREIPEQSQRTGYIKVRTVAVGLNPTDRDHTTLDGVGRIEGILGCDVSGFVHEFGPDCPNSGDLKVGDAVYGVCHGANLNGPEDGAYAEYAMLRDGRINKKPEGLAFEDVATLGVAITTVGQTLYMTLGLPYPGKATEPSDHPRTILISGGSSATGSIAIQFAKLSGLKVITTASPKHFDFVKGRGADEVFDYTDPQCGRHILESTKGSVTLALDCVSTTQSYDLIAAALPNTAPDGQQLRLVTLLPADTFSRKQSDSGAGSNGKANVKVDTTLAYTTMGEAFDKFGMSLPAIPPVYEHDTMFWKLAGELLAAGRFKPHPAQVRAGGLAGIPEGIKEFAVKKPSGYKIVFRTQDEPTAEVAAETVVGDITVEKRELGQDWAQAE